MSSSADTLRILVDSQRRAVASMDDNSIRLTPAPPAPLSPSTNRNCINPASITDTTDTTDTTGTTNNSASTTHTGVPLVASPTDPFVGELRQFLGDLSSDKTFKINAEEENIPPSQQQQTSTQEKDVLSTMATQLAQITSIVNSQALEFQKALLSSEREWEQKHTVTENQLLSTKEALSKMKCSEKEKENENIQLKIRLKELSATLNKNMKDISNSNAILNQVQSQQLIDNEKKQSQIESIKDEYSKQLLDLKNKLNASENEKDNCVREKNELYDKYTTLVKEKESIQNTLENDVKINKAKYDELLLKKENMYNMNNQNKEKMIDSLKKNIGTLQEKLNVSINSINQRNMTNELTNNKYNELKIKYSLCEKEKIQSLENEKKLKKTLGKFFFTKKICESG
jgi:hypothetical protein